ncbi:MAG: hypothetical protein ACO3C0_14165, partial [Burkholderiaceae bacterium]
MHLRLVLGGVHFRLALGGVIIASSYSAGVWSQTESVAEPVVISASRRPEPLWETPAALSFIGGEQLDGA